MMLLVKAGIILITMAIELLFASIVEIDVIKPDFILIVVICISFISGAEEGTIFGFAGGLLKDIFSVHFLGINALTKTLIGYVAGTIREKIFSHHIIWIAAISAFVFTVINNVMTYFLLKSLYSNYNFDANFKNITITQALINAIVLPLFFIGINKIFYYFRRKNK